MNQCASPLLRFHQQQPLAFIPILSTQPIPQSQIKIEHLARLQSDPPSGVMAAPLETNIMLWNAVIFGSASPRPRLPASQRSTIVMQAGRHAVQGRLLQAHARVHRGVPDQGAQSAIRVPDVPSQRSAPAAPALSPSDVLLCSLCRRLHLPGRAAEPAEPHIQRGRHSRVHPVAAGRTEPQQPREQSRRAALLGEQAGV